MTESGLRAAFGEHAGCTCTLKVARGKKTFKIWSFTWFLSAEKNLNLKFHKIKFLQRFRVLSTLGPHKLRCWHAGPLEDLKCSTKGKPNRTWSVIAGRKVEAVPTLVGFPSAWPRSKSMAALRTDFYWPSRAIDWRRGPKCCFGGGWLPWVIIRDGRFWGSAYWWPSALERCRGNANPAWWFADVGRFGELKIISIIGWLLLWDDCAES